MCARRVGTENKTVKPAVQGNKMSQGKITIFARVVRQTYAWHSFIYFFIPDQRPRKDSGCKRDETGKLGRILGTQL